MTRQLDVQYVRFYTDGSAARKVDTVQPMKQMQLPKVKKQKRIVFRVDPIAAMGIVVSVLMLVLMAVGVFQLKAAQQSASSMEDYVSKLEAENASLSATYEQSYDLQKVEETAIALGMVSRDQVQRVTIRVPAVEAEETPGVLDRFYTFLTGLFA